MCCYIAISLAVVALIVAVCGGFPGTVMMIEAYKHAFKKRREA